MSEICQRIKDCLQNVFGGLPVVVANNRLQPFIAEMFIDGIAGLFDAVGCDQDDLPRRERYF